MPIQNHKPGIYCITCLVDNKKYIGQTKSTTTRWRQHKCDLKAGRHKNHFLQQAFNLYGIDNFKFSVLEECDIREIGDEREVYWIGHYNSADKKCGYNIDYGGRATYVRSEETRLNMSLSRKGKPSGRKGMTHSEESKRKMSIANKGLVPWMKGKKHSDESNLKNSLSHTGKPSGRKGIALTKEAKKKISDSKKGQSPPNKGVPMSQEQKNKLSLINKGREAPNKGKPMSEEQKEKLKNAWVKRKLRNKMN